MSDPEFDAAIEKVLRNAACETFLACIETARREPQTYFMKAYIDGTLSAIAVHLTREFGPQRAYEVFQRLADECVREVVGETDARPSA